VMFHNNYTLLKICKVKLTGRYSQYQSSASVSY
jgi:hypothetical protein